MTEGALRVTAPGLGAPPRLLTELTLVAGAALVQIGGTIMAARNQLDHDGLGVGAALVLALGVLALPIRHRFPVGVLAFTFCTTLAYWSLDNPGGPVFVSLIVALIHVVLIGRRRAAITSLVAGFVAFPWLPYLLDNGDRPSVPALAALAAWLAALISVGEVVRSRRDRAGEAARSAAEALRRQAADERVRIARDLHDSVAHNMSLISIQAGVALHLMEEDRTAEEGSEGTNAQVREALEAIKGASKEALVELRSILGVLRHVDDAEEMAGGDAHAVSDLGRSEVREGDDAGAGAPRAPVPDLQRLDDLVERAGSTGLDVQVELGIERETLQALPHPVGVAAFRIIQESLTNVVRHSDSATAVVRIGTPDRGVLAVEVLDEGLDRSRGDTGRSLDLTGGGSGIAGMRERAVAVGGRLEAGPRPGRGFAVRAELPVDTLREDARGEAT